MYPADVEQPLYEAHEHFSHRAPWLRAFVMGANDGLVSVTALMLGVGASSEGHQGMILSGLAGLVAGALSMAVGEFISVSSQRDSEEADIEKERQEQLKGDEARRRELEELVDIYMSRGLREDTARLVAQELTEVDVIRAHARDELGIDMDALANPLQAAWASGAAFTTGAGIPLAAGFALSNPATRIGVVAAAASLALILLGILSAWLGGAHKVKAAARVLLGGWAAMGITYGIGLAFGGHIAG